ncbi:MAG: SusD/RagB family nutrient-binding outer membrane lipoprotein, partial [Chitinophagaceae bacterium]|nr:SusD/RagB family nutrient-binding outer membrane lipoprotein [Chitinophagaceae bacterium]
YEVLRNNKFVYDKGVKLKSELHQGISLVMKCMVFGMIADMWGDAPYTQALMADNGDSSITSPAYDSQQTIYEGILADLETANTILSKQRSEYTISIGSADVYYNGDPAKWRKLANSLALRYYMRISDKMPSEAQTGIEKIIADPAKYPVITSVADDATMSFPGNSDADSWPSNATYNADSSNYRRIKLCNTLVTALEALHDPRISVYANKVTIFLHVSGSLPSGTDMITDTVVNGESRQVRYISPDVLSSKSLTVNDINQDVNYVGLPVALSGPQAYNLSPDLNQASRNPHVSWVNSSFANAKSGIKARLLSAAEVHFILAEASAVKGWNAGDAETHYKQGIQSSFAAWQIPNEADNYIAQPEVAFDGTQKQIIEQKWIAGWSVATESWFDWRRTGFPELHGVNGRTKAKELPVRFYYELNERNLNSANLAKALNDLETTSLSNFGADGEKNSPWSKPWIAQGTGKPW